MGKVKWNDSEFKRLIYNGVASRMVMICATLVRDVKQILSGPRSGRVYRIGKGVVHRASAPGEPPAVLTGNLRASISSDLIKQESKIVGRVGTHVEYARYLELGTHKMAPRPFLRPALDRLKGKLGSMFGG